MDYVLQSQPTPPCRPPGSRTCQASPESIAYMTMFFDSPLIGHIHVNWLAPVKVRRTLLGGSRRMVVFDAHFAECVAGGGTPITDGESGLRVVRLLEAATESVAERGRLVSLNRAVVT